MVPYTGALGATVVDLRPGGATVRLKERRRVRNHLRSVHAVALANLGEVTTGLAVVASLPAGARGILTALRVEFRKKARGVLTCSCDADVPSDVGEPLEVEARADVRDATGDVVAEVTATWLVGPERPREPGA